MSSRSTQPLSPDDRRFLEGIASFDLSPEEEKRIWEEEKARRHGFYVPTAAPFMQDTILRLQMGAIDPRNGSRDSDESKRLVGRIVENHGRSKRALDTWNEAPPEMRETKRPSTYNPHEPSDNERSAVHMYPIDVMHQAHELTRAVRDMKKRILRLRGATFDRRIQYSGSPRSPEEMSLHDIQEFARSVQASDAP
jgi:hypothetical protein